MNAQEVLTGAFILIDKLPVELRRKLHGVRFIVDDESFILTQDGVYVKAETLGKNEIIFYPMFIADQNDLKETLIHELAHSIGGMNEIQVRGFVKDYPQYK